jgi:hypothetical protein
MDLQNGNEQNPSDEEDDEQCETNNEFDEFQPFIGNEGQDGIFDPTKSLVFATLEVLMCVLVRQVIHLFLLIPMYRYKYNIFIIIFLIRYLRSI